MKRIAICLCGHVRTWKKVIDTWKNIAGEDIHVDYFIHMFSETSIPIVGLTQRQIELIDLDESEINDVINTIKPVSYIVEKQKDFIKTLDEHGYYDPYECQYYSINKSCQLKSDYEKENNFKYDIVVKSRFDLFFKHNIVEDLNIKENTIYAYSPTYDDNGVLDRVTDIFYYADSNTFDKLTNYYYDMKNLPEKYKTWDLPPEFAWYYFITSSGIDVEVNHWEIKVMRNNIDEVKNKNFDYEMI